MPIFVTVQPDEATRAECLIYATGAPMLAIHDPSASVMLTVGETPKSAAYSAQFAGQLVRAGQQFEYEARRCAGLTGITGELVTGPIREKAGSYGPGDGA